MAKKLILHVGAPKTGTSFVQDLLFREREALRDGHPRGDPEQAGQPPERDGFEPVRRDQVPGRRHDGLAPQRQTIGRGHGRQRSEVG